MYVRRVFDVVLVQIDALVTIKVPLLVVWHMGLGCTTGTPSPQNPFKYNNHPQIRTYSIYFIVANRHVLTTTCCERKKLHNATKNTRAWRGGHWQNKKLEGDNNYFSQYVFIQFLFQFWCQIVYVINLMNLYVYLFIDSVVIVKYWVYSTAFM